MMNVLSFDCAIKRLGVCYVRANTCVKQDILKELEMVKTGQDPKTHYENIVKLIDNAVVPIYMENVDLTPGKKVGAVDQVGLANALCNALTIIDNIADQCDTVLIECQPNNLNNRSSIICGQLLYHYILRKNAGLCTRVELVSAKLKNKVSLGENMDLSIFKKRNYASNYTCNKAHSLENFKHWTSTFNVDLKKIRRPLTDVADAFMQIMGWLQFTYVVPLQ